MTFDGYANDEKTGALYSIDRTIRANYDHAYVARYEKYPQQLLSKIRVELALQVCGDVASVCDVGFGTGAFLEMLHRYRPEAHLAGFDVSPYAPPTFVEICPDWNKRKWSLVTFFDSLEHFDKLPISSEWQAETVMVSVPWFHPHLGEEWFANWKHRRPGEHLWHFTPDALCATFAEHKYRPIYLGNPEDAVRNGDGKHPNILTMIFQR